MKRRLRYFVGAMLVMAVLLCPLTAKRASAAVKAPYIYRSYYAAKNKAFIKWKKSSGAEKYRIYEYKNEKWNWIKTVKSTSATLKLNQSKRHTLTVRALKDGKRSDGYAYILPTANPSVKGNYKKGTVYGPNLNTAQRKKVKQAVAAFKKNFIFDDMTQFEKIRMIMAYMQETVNYSTSGKYKVSSAYGALISGKAHCQGYSRTVMALCAACGIKAYYVKANGKSSNPYHKWNVVRIGGKYYILDSQVGVFLVSDKTYRSMGLRWNTKGIPACKSDYPWQD